MSSSKVSFTRKEGDSEILVVLNMATTTTSATLTGLSAGASSRLSTAHKKTHPAFLLLEMSDESVFRLSLLAEEVVPPL